MADIVLTTFNARYIHAAFGLRYLHANLGALADRARVIEFETTTRTIDAIERVLSENPKIVGVGVYIWNAEQSLRFVKELKRIRPECFVIVGGPEVSYEIQEQEICQVADCVIAGEADLEFARVCERILGGVGGVEKVVRAALPRFEAGDAAGGAIALPYDLYTDTDLARRVIYVEASRGCPFSCEFCLSSLDVPVRNVPLEPFLAAMQKLLDRGCRQFKFVDRTFNLNLKISQSILEFFLKRYQPGMFVHFEMIPDRLPEPLRDVIGRFPPGALQFEVGIQTFNPEVEKLITRRQDHAKLEDNLRWLRVETGVHVHADLIAGLPGEDLQSFGRGFDKLVLLGPQEIQVGILKRLRGTPIVRHDAEWGMVWSPAPPYEILQTKQVSFGDMQRIRRFSRYWDLIANSGNFVRTLPLIWRDGSPFESFMRLSDWVYATSGQTHAISLSNLSELLFRFLIGTGVEKQAAAESIWEDYQRAGRSDQPGFLKGLVPAADTRRVEHRARARRQDRHRRASPPVR